MARLPKGEHQERKNFLLRLLKRLHHLEEFLLVCSWCRRVGDQGEWLTTEEYFGSKFATHTSHGICPECVKSQYPEMYADSTYRAAVTDPTFGPNQVAYRFFGTTHGARIGVNFSLSEHHLVGAGFQRTATHAAGGNDYSNSTPELTWNYQF